MTEKEFQNAVLKLAKMCGWEAYHTHDARRSEAGFPDLVLAHPRKGVLFAELKTDRGRLRPAQRRWLSVLNEGGARAYLWRPNDLQAIADILGGNS